MNEIHTVTAAEHDLVLDLWRRHQDALRRVPPEDIDAIAAARDADASEWEHRHGTVALTEAFYALDSIHTSRRDAELAEQYLRARVTAREGGEVTVVEHYNDNDEKED